MIQKGIIEEIISKYQYKVRIPRYDKLYTTPDRVTTEDLSTAIVCSVPGTKVSFALGDVVLVAFENSELNRPVILGLLYREEFGDESQFSSPKIDKLLDDLTDRIDALENENLYTHIKYSNDNGLTLTSLYEYTDVKDISTGLNTYVTASDIKIDPSSTVIYWSIIDSNNVDVTSKFNITTTLSAGTETESFQESLIKIPVRLKGYDELNLSFSILKVENYSDYHIVLTTDKNTLGSIYGDYMGICVSPNAIPPLDLSQYSWTSFYDIISNLVAKLEEYLLPRVERNEKTLYGYTYSTSIQESDGTGLLDGVNVSTEQIDIHGADNKDIIFNSSKSIYIDNDNENLVLNDIEYTIGRVDTVFSEYYSNKGHLTTVFKKKVSN